MNRRDSKRRARSPRNPFTGELRRAHDMRRLRGCFYCKGLALEEVLLDIATGLVHVECFVAREGERALFDLPKAQREKVRLSQVSQECMAAILDLTGAP